MLIARAALVLCAALCVAALVFCVDNANAASAEAASGSRLMTSADVFRNTQRELLGYMHKVNEVRQKYRALYQSPESGNSGSTAEPTTIAEIDNNTAEWIPDRPHNESFFFPSDCPTSERECCLSYLGQVCGGPERGTCKNITEDDSVCRRTEGLFWFTTYFDSACVCNGNYWGPACDQCKTGWMGDTCSERAPLIVRHDFAKLSDVDKQYVIDTFRLAKITPSVYQPAVSVYDFWAVVHHWSLPGGVADDVQASNPLLYDVSEGHVGSGAIPYHRALVGGFERALQQMLGNYSWGMPYWNWTYSAGTDNDPTIKWYGGDGDTNEMGGGVSDFCRQQAPDHTWMAECDCRLARGPFAHWPLIGDWGYPLPDTVERAFGCHSLWAPSLPAQPAVDCTIMVSQFDMPTMSYSAISSLDDEGMLTRRAIQKREWARTELKVGSTLYSDGAVFHNLLGGGFLCDGHWTWPMAEKETDLHERTHRWLAGTLLGHHPASDPLFWMLHSYADVIYEQWIRSTMSQGKWSIGNSWSAISGPLGHTRYECQGPYYPLQRQIEFFNDSRLMGFTYDIFNDDPNQPELRPPYVDSTWIFSYPTMAPLDETFTAIADVDDTTSAPEDTTFFFPSECDSSTGRCCPKYKETECGGELRGTCMDITANDDVCDFSNHASSYWWFTDQFTYACVCSGNFDGVNCGVCKPGYEGEDCLTPSPVKIRRDFSQLSDDDRDYVVDAFRLANRVPSAYQPSVTVMQHFASTLFWTLPGHSVAALQDTEAKKTYGYHGNMAFQRQLLLKLEQEMSRITQNSSFVLPYWNWGRSQPNDNEPFFRFFGGDGATNSSADDVEPYCRVADRDGRGGCNCTVSRVFGDQPLYGNFGQKIGTVQRTFECLHAIAAGLPTNDVVDYVVTIENYYSSGDDECFAKTMTGKVYENADAVRSWPIGMYGAGDMMWRVQNWVAGTMTTPDIDKYRSWTASPGSDPMYYPALAYSDLLLERWLRGAELAGTNLETLLPVTGAERGLNRDECMPAMVPLTRNSDMLVQSTNMGYTYDYFTS